MRQHQSAFFCKSIIGRTKSVAIALCVDEAGVGLFHGMGEVGFGGRLPRDNRSCLT